MERIAILGAGTMGHALAAVFSMGGHAVRLYDVNETALQSAYSRIESIFETLNESGTYSSNLTGEHLDLISLHNDLAETVSDADIVIEAIIEDVQVKKDLYEELAPLMKPEAILASNTSHLNVFDLVPACLQTRALIMHWYTPPYIIDLVDIAPGPETEAGHIEKTVAVLERLDKKPLVFKEFIQGYIANRLQAVINAEVTSLLDANLVTPRDIDISIREGLGLRMLILGVLAKADFTDLNLMDSGLRNRAVPIDSVTLENLLKDGHIGVKSGKGFYDWKNKDPDDLAKKRDLKLLKIKNVLNEVSMMLGE